jgi:GNAT superfamily N-acetyltransferase
MALLRMADGTAPDVSIRPAQRGDEAAITRIQLASWRVAPGLGDEVVDLVDSAAVTARWFEAIDAPPGPGFAVFVALDGTAPDDTSLDGTVLDAAAVESSIAGFAAVSPGQVLALEVDPARRRRGHGSRLLTAAVERLRADGAGTITTWLLDADTARERFFTQSGLGPDGPRRTLITSADGARTLTEHRWSALL